MYPPHLPIYKCLVKKVLCSRHTSNSIIKNTTLKIPSDNEIVERRMQMARYIRDSIDAMIAADSAKAAAALALAEIRAGPDPDKDEEARCEMELATATERATGALQAHMAGVGAWQM